MAFTYGSYGYAKDSNGTTIAYNGTNVYQIRLGYQVNSQDIENNKSNISLQLEVRSINSQYKTYGYNQTTTIDGTSLSAKTFDFRSTNTWQIFGTRTFDVTHNADGTYSVSKSGSFTTTASGSGRPKSGSASVTVTLPTIPRASTITVNDANIGSGTTITLNKASSSFTTTISYKAFDENSWTTIVTKTSQGSYGWTVPTSFYSKIPSSKTMTCQFQAETFSGNTSVGTKTTTATFTATGNPTLSTRTATDVNSTTANLTSGSSSSSTKMVKYASNIKVQITAVAQNSAYISSVKVNGSNVSLDGSSSSSTRSGNITFNGAETNTFSIVVTDSRGNSTTQNTSNTLTMVNYVPLTINATIKRNQPTDNKINITASGNYFNGSFGSQSNTLTIQYRYKESTSSSWGSWTTLITTLSGNTYTGSTQLSSMDYTKQYDFEIKATDKVGTKSISGIKVSKGEPAYWWDSNKFITNNHFYANTINGLGVRTSYIIPSDPANSFQTTLFGSNNDYSRMKMMRTSGGTSYNGFPSYAATLVGTVGDTHMFLSAAYNDTVAYIGGGSADKIRWYKQLAWKDDVTMDTVNQSDFCTVNSGFTMQRFFAYKMSNFVTGTMVIKSSNEITSTSIYPITVKSPYRPPTGYYSFCALSSGDWKIETVGYVYYSRGQWVLFNNTGQTGMYYAVINFSYMCD